MNKTRTILITGASGVVGSELVSHFCSAGDVVVALAGSEESADRLRQDLDPVSGKGSVEIVCIDLEAESGVDQVLRFLQSKELRPEALINGARNLDHLKLRPDHTPSRENWLREFTLGIIAPYQLSIALQQQAGSCLRAIVNLSSIYGLVAPNPALYADFSSESPVHYGVVKAALNHLTKELSIRMVGAGIRVNTVTFGGVRGRANKEFEARYNTMCPSGRMLDKHEIPGAVDFLLSAAASGITGHNLVVDGGWTVW